MLLLQVIIFQGFIMIDLKGKTALVTGSSRGVGQQIVIGLAKLGCNIILHGRTKDSLKASKAMLSAYEVDVYEVYGELSEEAQVDSIVAQVQSLGITVDVLYNNAAVMTPYYEDFWAHSWEEWALSMKVNVYAMFSLCKAFIPKMIAQGFGRVVNVTSGIAGEPELMPYASSKWAVNKMTEDISVKLKDTNVRINTLDPTWLQTDLGGPNADNPVEAVMPGALAPVLIENDGPNGTHFCAIN